ncbi:MAG: hypothetical protein J6S83_11785 [Lachnospiraceae bacterium]|nr:hypothetical protein [Lachnospiraceae bacterium]
MAEDGLILSQFEYEHLLEEIHKLQARIAELTALRDDLVYHVCPSLRAEYDEKIVSLERELMAANMYLRELQRTVEILQAQMNQQQEPSVEEAQEQARKENKEYEDNLNRQAEEAREFRKKWEESQWAKHDREEREAREKEAQEAREKEQQKKKDEEAHREGEEGNPEAEKDRLNGEQDHPNGEKDRQQEQTSDENSAGRRDDPEDNGRPKKEETIAEKIRHLYRKIIKRLHPDVNPDLTEHEKELWNRAVKAQQEGDLKGLERIWDELSGMDAPEEMFDDTPEGRTKLKELLEKLKVRLRLLELEIDHIKSDFPYKMKAFLEDPVAVEEVRRGMLSKIDNVREMNRQLETFIEELKEKLRKGEKL